MIPKLPMAVSPCAHFRYDGKSYGCELLGTCEPAKEGNLSKCPKFIRVYRKEERERIRRESKPKLTIDQLAQKRRKCGEAKAKGKPCTEFGGRLVFRQYRKGDNNVICG